MSRPPEGGATLAALLADSVNSCPSVLALSGGSHRELVTYVPGGIIEGVRIAETSVAVGIVAKWVPDLLSAAAEVRAALRPFVGTTPIDVHIADIGDPRAGHPTDIPWAVLRQPSILETS